MIYQTCGLDKKRLQFCIKITVFFWCGWRDLNPHELLHWNLNPARSEAARREWMTVRWTVRAGAWPSRSETCQFRQSTRKTNPIFNLSFSTAPTSSPTILIMQKHPDKSRGAFTWCGWCRSLRKRLIIVFRAKSEARAELCPVDIRVKTARKQKNKDQVKLGLYLVRMMSLVKKTIDNRF